MFSIFNLSVFKCLESPTSKWVALMSNYKTKLIREAYIAFDVL